MTTLAKRLTLDAAKQGWSSDRLTPGSRGALPLDTVGEWVRVRCKHELVGLNYNYHYNNQHDYEDKDSPGLTSWPCTK